MDEDLLERVTELEIRLTHQARLLEELNDVVSDCNLRIDQLHRDNRDLRKVIQGLAPLLEESPDE